MKCGGAQGMQRGRTRKFLSGINYFLVSDCFGPSGLAMTPSIQRTYYYFRFYFQRLLQFRY
jgi:hypothetical protein